MIASLAGSDAFVPDLPSTAGELARGAPTVPPTALNSDVMALFNGSPDLDAVVVIDDGRPTGTINRAAFFDRFAGPFQRDIFLRRACTTFMNAAPVLVEAATPISEVGAVVARLGREGLGNGFVITDHGRYRGHCDGFSLVQALADLQAEQHRQLLSSIDYARAIQSALLAESRAALKRTFGDAHAVDWEPRDLVGGDCFFAADDEQGVLVGLIDCTGHGVPGALLTSIVLSEVNRLAAQAERRRRPADLLRLLNQRVKAALQQTDDAGGEADEGMDAIFVWIPYGGSHALAASANLPMTVMDADGQCQVFRGDRRGVGYRSTPADAVWTEQTIPMGPGLRLVLATDGVCDQIGGPKTIAFGWKRFRQALAQGLGGSASTMIAAGRQALLGWQADGTRRDDVTMLLVSLDESTWPAPSATALGAA